MVGEKLPGMLFGFALLGSVVTLLIYWLACKFFSKLKFDKKIVMIILGFCLLFFGLTVASGAVNVSGR